MAKDIFPVDIFTVKKYGVEKWQQDFFWPVSDGEFIAMHNAIEQCFDEEINARSREVRTLLVIQYALVSEYANFLHALKVIQCVQSIGMDIHYSEKTHWYKNILEGKAVDMYIPQMRQEIDEAYNSGKIERVKVLLNTLKYNLKSTKSFTYRRKKRSVKVFGSMRAVMEKYANKLQQPLYFTSRHDWLPKNRDCEISDEVKAGVKGATDSIIKKLISIAKKNDIRLSNEHRGHLKNITENLLKDTSVALCLVEKNIKNGEETHLLISAIGKAFSRTLSIAVQRQGGRVTSFVHGGDVGFLNLPILLVSSFDIMTANDFVTYTEKSAGLYEKIKSNYSKVKNNKLKILSAESYEFFRFWKKHGSKSRTGGNKKVMIIGYPHIQFRRQLPAGLSLARLDLELKLVDALKGAGYRVLYKAHPGRINEVKGIFENKAEVIRGYFQDCMDKADVFLFPTLTSTAFPFALCTNKPIITLDLSIKLFNPFPDAIALFKKRCRVVKTGYDERNHITFDKKELLETLSQAPGEANNEFIKTYLFPGKVRKGSYAESS